jgi:hypothetical protein
VIDNDNGRSATGRLAIFEGMQSCGNRWEHDPSVPSNATRSSDVRVGRPSNMRLLLESPNDARRKWNPAAAEPSSAINTANGECRQQSPSGDPSRTFTMQPSLNEFPAVECNDSDNQLVTSRQGYYRICPSSTRILDGQRRNKDERSASPLARTSRNHLLAEGFGSNHLPTPEGAQTDSQSVVAARSTVGSAADAAAIEVTRFRNESLSSKPTSKSAYRLCSSEEAVQHCTFQRSGLVRATVDAIERRRILKTSLNSTQDEPNGYGARFANRTRTSRPPASIHGMKQSSVLFHDVEIQIRLNFQISIVFLCRCRPCATLRRFEIFGLRDLLRSQFHRRPAAGRLCSIKLKQKCSISVDFISDPRTCETKLK